MGVSSPLPFPSSNASIAAWTAFPPLLIAALMLLRSCGLNTRSLYPGASRSDSGLAKMPASLCETMSFSRSSDVFVKFLDTITRDGSCVGVCATRSRSGEGSEGVTESCAGDRLRLFVAVGGCASGFDILAVLGLPRRPEDFCGCSVSETMAAGVLGGSALIFWLERPLLRRSVGVSEVLDAIDWDREAAKADGVALAACLPLGVKPS